MWKSRVSLTENEHITEELVLPYKFLEVVQAHLDNADDQFAFV